MMKHVVFVVEGQTEQIFTQRFISELTVRLDLIHFEHLKLSGGELITIGKRGVAAEDAKIVVQIINAQGDDSVQSFISDPDRIESFKKKGVRSVYGLRDRFTNDNKKPSMSIEAIDALKNYFQECSSEWGVNVRIVIAIEEIEAWFFAEPAFFQKLSPELNRARIEEILGDGFLSLPVESIRHPANDIHKLLSSVGQKYRKREHDSHRISESIDISTLYLERSQEIPALKEYVQYLEEAITFDPSGN